jgi:hypothetical protein
MLESTKPDTSVPDDNNEAKYSTPEGSPRNSRQSHHELKATESGPHSAGPLEIPSNITQYANIYGYSQERIRAVAALLSTE